MNLRALLLFVLLAALVAGCKKSDSGTAPETPSVAATDYFPLVVGHSWTYNTSGTLPNGSLDPKSVHMYSATVSQTPQTIGGRPDATIFRTSDELGHTDNVVFAVDASRMWAYLGDNFSMQPQFDGYIYFWGGGYSSSSMVTIGLGKQERYLIQHFNSAGSMYIKRAQNAAVATASIVGPDTLILQGVSLGLTDLVLAPVGSPNDTMLVAIQVVNKVSGSGPPITQWMPLWEYSAATAVHEMFKYDTTFTFTNFSGVVVTDHILHLATSQYLLTEQVNAASSVISADKYQIQISITETIDVTGGTTHPVFSGLSAQATANVWLAHGIGFVKGSLTGAGNNAFNIGASMLGYVDSVGVLIGMFSSPRVQYYNVSSGSVQIRGFSINTQPAPAAGTYSIVLASKNF